MTLVEVLGSLLILGLLLGSLLTAQSNFQVQRAQADRQLQALALADRLLNHWYTQDEGIPVDQEALVAQSLARPGAPADPQAWSWRTALGDTANQPWGLQRLDLTVIYTDDQGRRQELVQLELAIASDPSDDQEAAP
jgi:type II secretory pathway pseudopilin PulG